MAVAELGAFIDSTKGRQMISLDGFLYRRQRVTQGKSYWVCNLDQRRGCKARLHVVENTDPPVIISRIEEHNHYADFGQAEARVAINKMKKIAVESNRDPGEIYASVMADDSLSSHAVMALGDRDQIINALRNVRHRRTGMFISGEPEYNIKFVQSIEKYKAVYDYEAQKFLSDNEIAAAWKSVSEEVGESVSVCKDKWRNIKSALTRYFRQNPNTRENNYLIEHLEFVIPFIKLYPKNEASSLSLLNMTDTSFETPQDGVIAVATPNGQLTYQHSSPLALPHSRKPGITVKLSPTTVPAIPDFNTNIMEGSSVIPEVPIAGASVAANILSCTENNNSEVQIDDQVMHYLMAMKKRKREEESEDADVGFLKSLVPDMRKMTDEQKNDFKRNVLGLIHSALYKPALTDTQMH